MKELNPELLRKTASAIRELNRENGDLKLENEEFRKQAEATNLAVSMLKDGELDPEDFETKVAEFMGGDLEVIKTAMSLNTDAGSDFGTKNPSDDSLGSRPARPLATMNLSEIHCRRTPC